MLSMIAIAHDARLVHPTPTKNTACRVRGRYLSRSAYIIRALVLIVSIYLDAPLVKKHSNAAADGKGGHMFI